MVNACVHAIMHLLLHYRYVHVHNYGITKTSHLYAVKENGLHDGKVLLETATFNSDARSNGSDYELRENRSTIEYNRVLT